MATGAPVLTIGRIPYLNCEPFFAHLTGFPLVTDTPRALGRAVGQGLIDAAPFSLVDLLAAGDTLTALPLGIAVGGPVRSVLLFSHQTPSDLDGAVVGVTEETSTSVELLRLLLALRYEAAPRAWVRPGPSCDALLLIGDAAIHMLTERHRFAHVVDLAEEWTRWTGLPFVFARWGVRRAAGHAAATALEAALEASLAHALEPGPLAAIAHRRRDTGFTEREVVAYLRAFTYRLGPDEDKAIAEFRRRRGFVEGRPC
jgi:chorismate dehydratase